MILLLAFFPSLSIEQVDYTKKTVKSMYIYAIMGILKKILTQ